MFLAGFLNWCSISSTFLRTAFTPVAPKSVKVQSSRQYLFTLLGSTSVKVVRRMLMKLNPGLYLLMVVLVKQTRFWCTDKEPITTECHYQIFFFAELVDILKVSYYFFSLKSEIFYLFYILSHVICLKAAFLLFRNLNQKNHLKKTHS